MTTGARAGHAQRPSTYGRSAPRYVADGPSNQVFVLDASTCNVARTDGCAPLAAITTGAGPFGLALSARSHMLYTANIAGNSVSVIDVAHCNATDVTGCAATPAAVALDDAPNTVAIDPATNTAYVSQFGAPVAVLHGAERVGSVATAAWSTGLAVDPATHTLYVTDFADFDLPGSVSVVDTSVCNGLDVTGCGGTWPTTPTGRGPWALTVDPSTHRVFSANFPDATVSVIDGADCNALNQRGCDRVPARVPIGNVPLDIDLAARDRTLYTANAPDLEVSVIDADTPCRSPVRCEP